MNLALAYTSTDAENSKDYPYYIWIIYLHWFPKTYIGFHKISKHSLLSCIVSNIN